MKTDTPLTREDLIQYFHRGIKPRSKFCLGIEWEKIGVDRETGRALSYSGPRGVAVIFEGLIRDFGWTPVKSGGFVIALTKPDGSITLEPGGQIELSGQTAFSLEENAREIHEHLDQIHKISDPLGVRWLGIGAQPISVAEDIEWVPKERYKIMREQLGDRGRMTYRMMKETASVQVSLDYESEFDAISKLKLAMGLSPFFVSMFANSPLLEGRRCDYLSRRALIWENTAPERTGIVWDDLDIKRGFESYVDFALSVPMLFILRDGQWISVRGRSFLDFMNQGWGEHRACLDDWELHLTGIFTEARMKSYIEIRSIDCQKTPMGLAAAALIKGLFYSDEARSRAWDMVAGLTARELSSIYHQAALYGLKAAGPESRPMQTYADKLCSWAWEGLPVSERPYLDPLRSLINKGQTPAELILACFDANQPLLHCAAI